MFLGQTLADITGEGGLVLPRAFNSALAEGLVVTRGFDSNLLVFPAGAWEMLARKLATQPLTDPNARQLRRRLFAQAAVLEMTDDEPLQLPRALREFAGLTDTAVLAGMFDHFEIWHPEEWTAVETAAVADGQDERWQSLGL